MTDNTKYLVAIKIPAAILGTICSIAMLPVTTTIIAVNFIWNSLKRCNMPEDQIRMVKNMYFGG